MFGNCGGVCASVFVEKAIPEMNANIASLKTMKFVIKLHSIGQSLAGQRNSVVKNFRGKATTETLSDASCDEFGGASMMIAGVSVRSLGLVVMKNLHIIKNFP